VLIASVVLKPPPLFLTFKAKSHQPNLIKGDIVICDSERSFYFEDLVVPIRLPFASIMSGTSQPPVPIDTTSQTLVRESSSNRQEHSDTQRSLQEASVALEVAYNRIRQVRRNLIELSESLPNPDTFSGRSGRVGTSYNSFGPVHDALVLSGGSREEQDAELSSIPPPIPPNRDVTSINQTTPLVPNDSTPYPSRSPTDSLPSFQPVVASNVLPPRFSRRDIVNGAQYLERRGLHESPATTRGLRVAAREANTQMTMDLSMLSAEYERILALQRDVDSPNIPSFGENSARWERSNRIQRNLDPRDGRRSIPAPSMPPSTPPVISWRAQDSRRWRMRPEVRLPMRPFSAEASDRLQALSNPMMNQDTLTQPPANLQPPQTPIDPRPDPVSGGAAEPSRRYRYATRADSAENNVNIDWSDEDFISWFSPAQDQHFRDFPTFLPRNSRLQNNAIRVTRTTDTAISSPENVPPRRGWGTSSCLIWFFRFFPTDHGNFSAP